MFTLHPQLRELADMARKQPPWVDLTICEVRAQMALRAAAKPKGPEIDRVENFTIPGKYGDIPLRLYRPRHPVGVTVALHGGGWIAGNLDTFDATCRHLAHESNLAIVSVDYHLAPEFTFPAALEDAWTATQWVTTQGFEALEVDCGRLVVLGESSGGNLAAGVCLKARDFGSPSISAQILIYPPVDARLGIESLEHFAEGYLQTKRDVIYAYETYGLNSIVEATDSRLSPLLAPSHSGLPVTLLISAGCDAIRDDTVAYTECLLKNNVEAIHVCYPNMLHTFFGMRGMIADAALAQRQVAVMMRASVL